MKLWSMSGPAQVFRKYRLLWTFSSCRFPSSSSSPQAHKGSGWTSSPVKFRDPAGSVARNQALKSTAGGWNQSLCNRKQSAPQSPDRLCWPMTWWNTGSKLSPTGTFRMELQQLELFSLLQAETSICHLSPSPWLNCRSMPRLWQLYPGPGVCWSSDLGWCPVLVDLGFWIFCRLCRTSSLPSIPPWSFLDSTTFADVELFRVQQQVPKWHLPGLCFKTKFD